MKKKFLVEEQRNDEIVKREIRNAGFHRTSPVLCDSLGVLTTRHLNVKPHKTTTVLCSMLATTAQELKSLALWLKLMGSLDFELIPSILLTEGLFKIRGLKQWQNSGRFWEYFWKEFAIFLFP